MVLLPLISVIQLFYPSGSSNELDVKVALHLYFRTFLNNSCFICVNRISKSVSVMLSWNVVNWYVYRDTAIFSFLLGGGSH
jgi:hypothetical protein